MAPTNIFVPGVPSIGKNKRRVFLGSSVFTPPPYVQTTYIADHFTNNVSNVSLVGWMPDTTGSVAWSKNAASPTDNATVSSTTKNVVGTNTTGSYYVNKTALPANYSVAAKLTDTPPTFSVPGILLGFNDTTLDGYRFYRDGSSASNTYGTVLQRAVAGVFTTVAGMGPGSAGFAGSGHNHRVSRWVMADRVRIKMEDTSVGATVIFDDTSASKITATNYPGLGNRQTGFVDDVVVTDLPPVNRGGSQLVSDGAWTWYNSPLAVTSGGKTYVGHVRSDGSICVSKLDNGVVTTFVLAAAFEIDDHDNPGLLLIPDGLGNVYLGCFYSKHSSDTTGLHYRISTNPLPDISSFRSEVTISNGGSQTAYCLPYILTDNIVRVYYRDAATTTRARKVAKASVSTVLAGTATWATSTVFQTTNARPYMQCTQTGPATLDYQVTNGHPNEVVTSVFHIRMTVDGGGVEHYWKSDGTEILTGLPLDVTTAGTLIDDATNGRVWNWGITVGSDGNPRCLWTKYPSSTGARDIVFSDVQYWHGRWNGTSWVKTKLADNQHSLYAAENHYVPGMAFDSADPTTHCSAEWDSTYNVAMLAEYTLNETTGVRTKVRDLATDPSSHQFRPFSPVGHGSDAKWVWLEGGYVTYGVGSAPYSTASGIITGYCFNATVRYSS
jgi:hypothetical protein